MQTQAIDQRALAYQASTEQRRERAKAVATVGVTAILTELIEFAQTLQDTPCLSRAEVREATAAILKLANELLAYQLQYHPKPVEIQHWPRQSW